MSSVHIYSEKLQPATRFRLACGELIRFRPRALWWANCCNKQRYAKYVVVQCYADGVYGWCKDGHGCKGR